VDDVELTGALEHCGDVRALGHLRLDAVVLGPAGGCGAVKAGVGDRVGGGEQGDIVAELDESFGQQRGEQLPRPVVPGRGPPCDRRQHGDLERGATDLTVATRWDLRTVPVPFGPALTTTLALAAHRARCLKSLLETAGTSIDALP